MIDASVLLWAIVALVVLLAGTATAWLAHTAWSTLAARRLERLRPPILASVAAALHGSAPMAEAERALARLPTEPRIGLLVEMSMTVAGEQRERLGELGRRGGVPERARRWHRSRRWSRRLRAARLLALFGDGSEGEGLALLADSSPPVRAQAAEWAASHPTPESVAALIALLEDRDAGCRFAARDGLSRAGRAALESLADFLAVADGVAAAGTLEAATGIASPSLLPAALRLTGSADPRVRARAATLASAIGGTPAAERLTSLLDDRSAEVREAAARGLGRLGHWPAAAVVVRLLEDRDHPVRRAAANALLRMGPTGELLLRRADRSGQAASRDIARNALGLPPHPGLRARSAVPASEEAA